MHRKRLEDPGDSLEHHRHLGDLARRRFRPIAPAPGCRTSGDAPSHGRCRRRLPRVFPGSASLREGERESQPACPKCGHTLWSDEGQRQTLLRMREVMANTEDRKSRSYDESDGREPKFYDKNMFVLKNDEDVTEAWYLDCDEVPFGFEFFRKITLREVNFGESNGGGARILVAGRERTARSFELCEACGKVRRNGELIHSPWCRYRK